MNKLNIYVIRDEVAQDNCFLCTAVNDEEAKRNIKLSLCTPQPNFINTHTKDKRLVFVGELDCDTGVITPQASPVLLVTIEEVRLELLSEVAKAKSQALDLLISEGITKEKYKEAKDLLVSLDPYFAEMKEEPANA